MFSIIINYWMLLFVKYSFYQVIFKTICFLCFVLFWFGLPSIYLKLLSLSKLLKQYHIFFVVLIFDYYKCCSRLFYYYLCHFYHILFFVVGFFYDLINYFNGYFLIHFEFSIACFLLSIIPDNTS